MTIGVIGAGFGRTGTTSLKAALEILGLSKCYHMQEVFAHPTHAQVWRQAWAGQTPDRTKLFAGYQATVDWPACTFYRQLMVAYPAAKVVLTVRDPAQWYASVQRTIYEAIRTLPSWLRAVPVARHVPLMQDEIIWQGTFGGHFADRESAIEVYKRHVAEVRQIVPPERLLVFDVKEGWEPLCCFLELPVPLDQPFPHLNDGAQFQRLLQIFRLLHSAPYLLLAVVAWWLTWRWRGSKAVGQRSGV